MRWRSERGKEMIKLKISKREKIDNLGVARWWELIMHEGVVRERE